MNEDTQLSGQKRRRESAGVEEQIMVALEAEGNCCFCQTETHQVHRQGERRGRPVTNNLVYQGRCLEDYPLDADLKETPGTVQLQRVRNGRCRSCGIFLRHFKSKEALTTDDGYVKNGSCRLCACNGENRDRVAHRPAVVKDEDVEVVDLELHDYDRESNSAEETLHEHVPDAAPLAPTPASSEPSRLNGTSSTNVAQLGTTNRSEVGIAQHATTEVRNEHPRVSLPMTTTTESINPPPPSSGPQENEENVEDKATEAAAIDHGRVKDVEGRGTIIKVRRSSARITSAPKRKAIGRGSSNPDTITPEMVEAILDRPWKARGKSGPNKRGHSLCFKIGGVFCTVCDRGVSFRHIAQHLVRQCHMTALKEYNARSNSGDMCVGAGEQSEANPKAGAKVGAKDAGAEKTGLLCDLQNFQAKKELGTFSTRGDITSMLQVMERCKESDEIRLEALKKLKDAFNNLGGAGTTQGESMRTGFLNGGGIAKVVEVIESLSTDESAKVAGCHVLKMALKQCTESDIVELIARERCLYFSSEACFVLQKRTNIRHAAIFQKGNGIDVLLSLMKTSDITVDVAERTVGVLDQLSSFPPNEEEAEANLADEFSQRIAGDQGCNINLFVDTCNTLGESNESVPEKICSLLKNMARVEKVTEHIVEKGGVDVLFSSMKWYEDEEHVQSQAWGAMMNLAEVGGMRVQRALVYHLEMKNQAASAINKVHDRNKLSEEWLAVFSRVCDTLVSIAERTQNDEAFEALAIAEKSRQDKIVVKLLQHIVPKIVQTIDKHASKNDTIQAKGCRFLSRLLYRSSYGINHIRGEVGMCKVAVSALTCKRRDEGVQSSACKIVSCLSFRSSEARRAIINKRGVQALRKVMKDSSSSSNSTVLYASKTLRNLVDHEEVWTRFDKEKSGKPYFDTLAALAEIVTNSESCEESSCDEEASGCFSSIVKNFGFVLYTIVKRCIKEGASVPQEYAKLFKSAIQVVWGNFDERSEVSRRVSAVHKVIEKYIGTVPRKIRKKPVSRGMVRK